MDTAARRRAETLKAWALECGFDRAGVARVERAAHGEAFLRWLDEGRQAGMGYLERRVEHRLDAESLVPGARSVLCVAMRYLVPQDETAGGDLWPRVARYARGDDYHRLMGGRLDALCRRIEGTFPGTVTRPYVDTGPVLEREWAARAGLGAIGKNTNLLHPADGSWLLLGEVFLGLDLAPDPPVADLCGSCRACLDACPTGALVAPYLLDSRLCISYWTIEHRGAVPPEVRPLVGDWVFGCDVCQEVCPINAAPETATEPALGLPEARRSIGLVELLEMCRGEYEERFRKSPMKRARRSGLRRNAAIAMGNRRQPRYVPALARVLRSSDDGEVRAHAAWALGRIGGERARAALLEASAREADPAVRAEIAAALG
ncbi:MAG TPA: tRNA epoxyqueuosine(34) reductase QueG [Thermoanaerobaculia bacterium]|nr:tRNA epoxyqueuosine(34) reductase QueG [Thermoanaerobaculia bacterium]